MKKPCETCLEIHGITNFVEEGEECPVCAKDMYKAQNAGRPKKLPKPRPEGNIAFKCAYCDGGATVASLGYAGKCSAENIIRNIEVKGTPCCCDKDGQCLLFYKKKIKYTDITAIEGQTCYESRMLIDWKALAGQDRKEGKRKGKRREIKKNVLNGLCVLTTSITDTRKARNEDRVVFAVFLIDKFFEGDEESDEGYVQCNSKYRIKLSPEEANQILFWNYYYFPGKPDDAKWKSGLYHFLDDYQCAQILRDIIEVKADPAEKALARELLDKFCADRKAKGVDIDPNNIPQNKGALTRQ